MTKQQEAHKGQAVYNQFVLNIYDWWVLKISNSYIWKCPSSAILSLFNRHMSSNHLDIGTGTGYFLRQSNIQQGSRVGLMDMNTNCLSMAAAKIPHANTEIYKQNILKEIKHNIPSFDSISINYLLHCLPGTLKDKSCVFDHLNTLLNPSGILFGSTILSQNHTKAGKKLMAIYNKKGIFSNYHDTLETLKEELEKRFREVELEVKGCVVLFSAKK